MRKHCGCPWQCKLQRSFQFGYTGAMLFCTLVNRSRSTENPLRLATAPETTTDGHLEPARVEQRASANGAAAFPGVRRNGSLLLSRPPPHNKQQLEGRRIVHRKPQTGARFLKAITHFRQSSSYKIKLQRFFNPFQAAKNLSLYHVLATEHRYSSTQSLWRCVQLWPVD